MESIKGNAIRVISGYVTLMNPNKDETAVCVPTAWIADRMETGHHSNQSGRKSLLTTKKEKSLAACG